MDRVGTGVVSDPLGMLYGHPEPNVTCTDSWEMVPDIYNGLLLTQDPPPPPRPPRSTDLCSVRSVGMDDLLIPPPLVFIILT